MTYDATVKLCYINNTEATISSKYFPEIVDKHSITIEAPAQDMNVHQHFELFKAFLRAMGFAEYSILDGACRLAFNDSNDEAQMKKLMNEYELQDKQPYTYDDVLALEEEVRELKAQLARVLPEQYDDEDTKAIIDESTDGGYKPWGNLVPGTDEAYAKGCKCPILDNQGMPNDKKWVNGNCPLHGKAE
jgi:hypothetical protein